MISSRLPRDRTPNALTQALAARRAAGLPLIDLTESNPTRVGLGGADAALLAALADPRGAMYAPDPRGTPAAREAVARDYARRGVAVDPAHVILTASTSEAYAHLFQLLAEPGDVFLTPAPSYPLFEPLAAIEGVRLAPYPLAYDGRWRLDADAFAAALAREPRARGAIVVQPNNPTGSCLTRADIEAVDAMCAARGVAIVSDEVFADFPRAARNTDASAPHDARARAPRIESLLGDRAALTFALGGLSKSCAMPQVKVAWIAACGPAAARADALEGLEWIADLFLSVSTPAQLALPQFLAAGESIRARIHDRLARNLRALDELATRHPALEALHADGGWSAMLRVPRTRDDEALAVHLAGRGVAVHPGHLYDCEREGLLVISLLPEPGAFADGLATVGDTVDAM